MLGRRGGGGLIEANAVKICIENFSLRLSGDLGSDRVSTASNLFRGIIGLFSFKLAAYAKIYATDIKKAFRGVLSFTIKQKCLDNVRCGNIAANVTFG